MSDEYAAVKRGKLILKGDKPKAKKRKHRKKNDLEDSKIDEDSVKHAGWWKISRIEDITGSISLEFGNGCYISALDNGLFTVGAPHGDGEGPSPEEIFTAFPAGETKFALKSGYGKYLGVTKEGTVIGRSDAVGPMEQWEPVWQDGKTAILSSLNKFMLVNPEDDSVVVQNISAGEQEFCNIRSNKTREENKAVVPDEEQADLAQVEVNYVCLSEKHLDKSKKVVCVFVDLEKAYDRVQSHELWSALVLYGVDDRLVRALKSLYENSKTCIRVNGAYTDWFNFSKEKSFRSFKIRSFA